ncbi:MAG: Photosystem I assembly protein Ycf3 [Anaerolineales bacterium]|nr:Photosystem I assembly protein Ycf3 [Anaerolineales bacterium]
MPDPGKTTAKFIIALLKHQAKFWLGEDAAGIAAETVLDEDVQARLDAWLDSEKSAKQLLGAVENAQLYLQDPRNCPDKDLRHLFRDLTFGDLPSVQAALTKLPQAMDSAELQDTLLNSFRRDLPNLSPEQHEEGARLYTDAILRAVGSLEEFVSPILLQSVLDLKKGQTVADKKLDRIIAYLEARLVEKRPSSPTLPGDLPIGSYLPIQPNPFFTGREAELQQLADSLCPPLPQAEVLGTRAIAITQQALVGMGGLGKTQLAIQFAWQYGYKFAGVHWVSAYKAQEINSSIALCGQAMNLDPWSQDVDAQAAITINAWKQSGPRLVILDNLEDMSAAASLLGNLRHSNIRILITTRQTDWSPSLSLRELKLPVFTEAESLVFLRRYLPPERATDDELASLHARLGGLPLPLDLAGSYLQHVKQVSIAEYLKQLTLDHPSLKNWRKKHPNATQHDKDVASTFALSWERIESEEAKRVFLLAGYGLPNEPLLRDVLQAASQLQDESFSDALDLLTGLSLIQEGVSLHPLLSEFARLQDTDGTVLFRWSRMLAWRCYPSSQHGGIYRDPNLARHARLSMSDLARAVSVADQDEKEASNFYFHLAFLNTHFGDLDGAMQLYQQAREILEGLGDLQGKSATLHNMAQIYVTRGDLDGAMQLYQQALQMYEGLGDLKGKSATLHAMANVFVTRGDLDGAMKLYQQSLEIKEGLGDLQGKSATLHNMAQIYVTRGDLDGAMKLYQQAREILEGLGDLQGKSATLHAMANVFVTRGDLDGAMKLYQQAREILEGLGDLQGKSATLHQMAGIYVTRGDLDGAMKLYQQAREILEGLGDLQGKSATLINMGVVLFKNDRHSESLSAILSGLQILIQLGAKLDIETVMRLLKQFQQAVGTERFTILWKEVTGSAELPDWLTQN